MIGRAQKLSQRFSHGACQFSSAPVRVQPVISTFNLLHLRQSTISRTAHLTLCQVHVERNYYYTPCAIHLRERERKIRNSLGSFHFQSRSRRRECARRSNRALSHCILHSPAPHIAQTARVKRALIRTHRARLQKNATRLQPAK